MRVFIALLLATSAMGQMNSSIQKIVNMMKQIETTNMAEEKSEKKAYEKFHCWAQGQIEEGSAAAAAAGTKATTLAGQHEVAAGKAKAAGAGVEQAKARRASAANELKELEAARDEAVKNYNDEKIEVDGNIATLGAAIKALSGGNSAFLQSRTHHKELVALIEKSEYVEKDDILSFLSSGTGSADQVVGMLSEMKSNAEDDRKSLVGQEEEASKIYQESVTNAQSAGKQATAALEKHLSAAGKNGVLAAKTKNELAATRASLAATNDEVSELRASQSEKEADYQQGVKDRASELEAVRAGLGVLTSPDNLAAFDKGMFIQVQHKPMSLLTVLFKAGKDSLMKPLFDKIDHIRREMDADQKADDKQKEDCITALRATAEEQDAAQGEHDRHEAALAAAKSGQESASGDVSDFTKQIAETKAGMEKLTAMYQDDFKATEQEVANKKAAVNVLNKAIEKMERHFKRSLLQTKRDQSGGIKVVNLMAGITKDLKGEIDDLKHHMNRSKAAYEANFKSASNALDALDEEKGAAEDALSSHQENGADSEGLFNAAVERLKISKEAKFATKMECDMFLKSGYDSSKKARADQDDNLQNAKAVLSGANY